METKFQVNMGCFWGEIPFTKEGVTQNTPIVSFCLSFHQLLIREDCKSWLKLKSSVLFLCVLLVLEIWFKREEGAKTKESSKGKNGLLKSFYSLVMFESLTIGRYQFSYLYCEPSDRYSDEFLLNLFQP